MTTRYKKEPKSNGAAKITTPGNFGNFKNIQTWAIFVFVFLCIHTLTSIRAYGQQATPAKVTPFNVPPGGGGKPPKLGAISGSTSVTPGQTAQYTVSLISSGSGGGGQQAATANVVSNPGNGYYYWYLDNPAAGTITGSSSLVSITWSLGYTGSTNIYCSYSNSYGESNTVSLQVTITAPPITPGSITPASQTISYNTIPATLTSSIPSGGNGTYNYTWQYSTDRGNSYTNINDALNLPSYTPSNTLTTTTTYRVVYSCTAINSPSVPSTSVVVNVNPPLTAPVLTTNKQTVNVGDQFTLTQSTLATGGIGTYTYSYQSSGNGTDGWAQIPGSTTTAPSCNVNVSSVNTNLYYMVTASSGGVPINSNIVKINIAGSGTSSCAVGTLVTSTSAITSLPPGQYYNTTGITLGPGFSANGATGSYSFTIASAATCGPPINLSQSQNYIVSYQPRVAGITSPATVSDKTKVQTTIQYFDGLGKPIQTVQAQASPLGNDLVLPQAYDQYGREVSIYLPYALAPGSVNDGSYKPYALTGTNAQAAFYATPPTGVTSMTTPFAGTAFEPSPLNRPTEQGAPGNAWQLSNSGISGSGHTVKILYSSNDGTKYWAKQYGVTIDATGNRALVLQGTYGQGQLYVTVTKNENWSSTQTVPNTINDPRLNTTEEYKDKSGHVLLKRTYNYTTAVQVLSTYYVYDDFGLLCYVLPPGANADVSTGITSAGNQAILNSLCYQYNYDQRKRMISKQLPGKGIEEMVYNQLNQLIYSRDANQASRNEWSYAKYDALGRTIMTGIEKSNATTRATLQSTVTQKLTAGTNPTPHWENPSPGSGIQGYSNNCIPNSANIIPLTVNYYDDYTFQGAPATAVKPATASVQTRGLPIASKTAVLNSVYNTSTKTYNTTPDMLWTVSYYDGLGRNIQSFVQHYLGGTVNSNNYDVISSTYNFTNTPSVIVRKHYNTSSTANPFVTITNTYVYDHVNRKLSTKEQITNGAGTIQGVNTTLSRITYNEVGQVVNKQLHSTDDINFLQNTAYAYNERGWLLKINDPTVAPTANKLFAEQINYNQTQYGSTAQYNGNIAEQVNNAGISGSQHVTYSYDNLNRLTAGNSSAGFSETGITYDLMGNITTLNRSQGAPVIDKLSYNYTSAGIAGNQLQSVTDGSGNNSGLVNGTTSYTYDANGNMLTNSNSTTNTTQNKVLAYNLLNLPQTVTVGTSTKAISITYVYDANGSKLRKISKGLATDYISGIQYKTDVKTIDFIATEEGRAINTGTSYNYEYTLTDHLGNNRVTFDMVNGKVGEDDYYPFGLNIHRQQNAGNKYLYNKKELQEELTEYDYGARFYDPLIARWNTVDPLAEKSRRWTPYNYCENNPIRNIDPDGMQTAEEAAQQLQSIVDAAKNAADNAAKDAEWSSSVGQTPYQQWAAENGVDDAPTITGGTYNSQDGDDETKDQQAALDKAEADGKRDAAAALKAVNDGEKGANQGGDPIRGIHVIYESETPTIYKNTLNALKSGLPYILHYEPSLATLNRAKMLSNYPVVSRSVQRDEYPYASTREGGTGLVFYVPGRENSIQGSHLSMLYSTLKPGNAFLVFLIARGQEPENEYAPNSNPIQISPAVKAGAAVGAILTILTWAARLAL